MPRGERNCCRRSPRASSRLNAGDSLTAHSTGSRGIACHWPHGVPDLRFDLPELRYPDRLNAATRLLDARVEMGEGAKRCIVAPGGVCWSYDDLRVAANRIANVLVETTALEFGNRVLLRAPNSPMLAACWFPF